MADIKQAARWMQAGYHTQRKDEPGRIWRTDDTGWLEVKHKDPLWCKCYWHNDDLLADDWEIAP